MKTLHWARFWIIAVILSAARLSALWLLLYREWSRRQSLSLLPLIIILYPEALWLPNDVSWTLARAIQFSGLLICGSFLIAAAVVGVAWAFRR